MRLAIMQPYFFPRVAHFALIARADRWVVFDVTQYTPKSWMNRNRVLHPRTGWMYVTVPLANSSQSIRTADARTLDVEGTRAVVKGKLSHYRRPAPFFANVMQIVDATFDRVHDDTLVSLDVASLQAVCEYIGVSFRPSACSKLGLDLSGIEAPGGWAPRIAAALGADTYINPIGGRDLFNERAFREVGVDLRFLDMPGFVYDTGSFEFVPDLSILDVLMWNAPDDIRAALETAELVAPVPESHD